MSMNSGFWHRQRVLVTGASGMVGSWLVKRLLEEGAVVVALVLDDDPQTELLRSGDVRRVTVVSGALEALDTLERALALHEVNTVFHLGAQTLVGVAHRAPLLTFESNIRGTYNLLEACRRQRAVVERVIVASSDKAYGEQALPYTEESQLDGRHPYEVSKSCADLLSQCYAHTYALPVAVARCGNIYGGGDLNWSRIVPGTIRDCLHGVRPVIRSDGTFRRDYIYVKDAVSAYMTLGEMVDRDGVRGQAFNFSDESPRTVLEIVAAIQRLVGREDLTPDIANHAVGEIRDQYLAAAKARRVLGWSATYDLDAGLGETIDWYRAFLAARAEAPVL